MSERVNGITDLSLSESHKQAVKPWVPKIRKKLEDAFEARLEWLGLSPTGKHRPVEKTNLPPEAAEQRTRAEALLHRESIAEGSAKRGFDNVKRELAYTLLNRLVGLKVMEARGLLFLPPPGDPKGQPERTEVITPVPGQAYSRFVRDLRAAGGARYKYEEDAEEALLRDALDAAFRHVTREIGILFDPEHDYACVRPTHATVVELIEAINGEIPEGAYRAPDFLGWIYQFFRQHENDELREKNKGTPQSPHELAVMNQFYTPGWVVKALVDNTLGRLWLQMHPDSALAPGKKPPPGAGQTNGVSVDYLVPRTGEKIRYQALTESGDVLSFKLARDITLLDPACGTMHFGQYAFRVFHQMYLDEIENAGKPGWPDEPSVPRPEKIPAAILHHNLYGIDIDPRAIQIAALSLLLTAKEVALEHGAATPDIRVRRTNLIVASAVNLGEDQLEKLVARVETSGSAQLRRRLFETIWENLANVGELGSLVQVREGISEVLDDWVEERAREKGLTKLVHRRGEAQLPLGSILEEVDAKKARQLELEFEKLEAEARDLQTEVLKALEAEILASPDDPADRLFAEDTARGFQLLQALSRSYDVVVMNPPYGSFVPKVKEFVRAAYPLTYNDIYAAFVDRAAGLTEAEGYVGALVSRTFVTHKTHERLRTEILLKRNPLLVLLDLGEGILEATVQTAAIVLKGSSR